MSQIVDLNRVWNEWLIIIYSTASENSNLTFNKSAFVRFPVVLSIHYFWTHFFSVGVSNCCTNKLQANDLYTPPLFVSRETPSEQMYSFSLSDTLLIHRREKKIRIQLSYRKRKKEVTKDAKISWAYYRKSCTQL